MGSTAEGTDDSASTPSTNFTEITDEKKSESVTSHVGFPGILFG